MKTEDLPSGVPELASRQIRDQLDALELATTMLKTWESVQPMYEAQKAVLPDDMKLRIRRIAESARDALQTAKSTFTDAEAWLDAWAKAGQRGLVEFARLGAQVPAFEAGPSPEVAMPVAKATLAVLDKGIADLGELVWDGDLYETFTKSKETR